MSYNVAQRLVTGYSALLLNAVDYQVVNPILQKDINESKDFLNKTLMS